MKLTEERAALRQRVAALQEKSWIKASPKAAQAVTELARDLENDFFTVVVLGEFKRGKTTLMNALLGTSLLPVNVLPETATINALLYNDTPVVRVVKRDGSEEAGEATAEYLARFSARSEGEDFADIQYLKIGYPADILRDRLVLVDTPGVSDINEQRCEVTYRFLPRANAVLFLLDANSPLKKTEKDFIDTKLLPLGLDNILFVANKYDMVDEEEDAGLMEDLRRRLRKAFRMDTAAAQLRDVVLYPLSAQQALAGAQQKDARLTEASGIAAVRERLRDMVFNGTMEAEKLQQLKRRLEDILLGVTRELENARRIAAADVDELTQAEVQLRALLAEQEQNKVNIAAYVEQAKGHMLAMVDKSLHHFHEKLKEAILDDVQLYKGADFKDYVEVRISKRMQREMEAWLAAYAPHVDELLVLLERELAHGLSYHFQQRICIETKDGQVLQGGRMLVRLETEDVSGALTQAGVLAAAGAGLLMLVGIPGIMPMISFAAFPKLRELFMGRKLDQAKAELIPTIESQLAKGMMNLEQQVSQYVSSKCQTIQANTEYAYETVLTGLQQRISEEITQKRQASEGRQQETERLTAVLTEIDQLRQENR